MTPFASDIPLKASWNPQTASLTSTVSRIALKASPAAAASSLTCGTSSDIPAVPTLTIFGSALLALILIGAAVTRL